MSIPKIVTRQRDFSGGQQDASNERRDDQKETRSAARTMKNLRALSGGPAQRRPGRRVLFLDGGRTEKVRPTPATEFTLTMTAGTLTIRDELAQTRHTFTGEPWTADLLYALTVQQDGARVYIGHQTFRPRVVAYDEATDAWVIDDYAYLTDSSGATREPFWRYAPTGITIQPSARTGSVTIEASAGVFDATIHVGNRIRYSGKQIEITSVTDADTAVGTVIEELPPTFDVTVANSGNFAVGDAVEGRTSGSQGHVVQVTSGHLFVVVTSNYAGFSNGEKIVGPNSETTVSSQSSASPGATFVWDECFMSDYRGWPGSISADVQRIIFTNFRQLGRGIIWSAIGDGTDLRAGANASDAIFEVVPDNCIVQHVIGGEDEFVFTDKGVFYVPISGASPLVPGSVEFRRISSDGASSARPAFTTEGLVYLNFGATRVLSIVGTGQTTRPYIVQDTSELHSDLINDPVCLVAATGDARTPERYLYVVNADGTLAVGRYNAREQFAGWTPWDGDGLVRWLATDRGDVLFMVTYDLPGGERSTVEVLDEDYLLDGAVELYLGSGIDVLELTTGEPLELYGGGYLELDGIYALAFAEGAILHVFDGEWYRGEVTVGVDGVLEEDLDTVENQPLYAGFNYIPEFEPFIPGAPEGQSVKQSLRRRKVAKVSMRVQQSNGFEVEIGGHIREVPAYRAGENEEERPPLRDETYTFRGLGRDHEPRVTMRQRVPGRLTMVEWGMEVTV